MERHLTVAVCYCLSVIVGMVLPVLGTCTFPDFLQSDAGGRDWRGEVRSQFREFALSFTIRNSKMIVESAEPGGATYERICLQALSDGRYITAHEESRQRDQRYVCMQFFRRSDTIVQMRVSDVSGSMFGICDESKLRLDPWLLVDKNGVLDESHLCSLTGGYSVKLYDREFSRGTCDAYKDHVWLESECIPGTGLYFNFRYSRCIPNVMMSSQQRTICVANWTEGVYSFMVLRHDRQRHLWVMRYPANVRHLASFVAHLMKDMYAATTPHITQLDTYVQLDMVRDIAHPVTSLCIDEFEGCSYYADPCSGGGQTALTCARTCGVCNETRPLLCSFSDTWRGDWMDTSHSDRVAATVESRTLTVYYNRLEQRFHCVRWDEPHGGGSAGKHTTYRMLVTEFANGCRPRYSCARVVHRTSSPVMFLQLSSERHWPFTSRISDPIDCDHFDFDGDPDTLIPNRYRSKHYRLLYSKLLDTGTTCNMPLGKNATNNYTVILADKTRCSGRLRTSSSGSTVSLVISGCDADAGDVLRHVPTEHTCLESSRLFGSDYVVVSRTYREPYELYCWLFPRRSVDTFHLVKSAHCNDGTRRRIARGHFAPLATFSGRHPAARASNVPLQSTPLLTEASRGYVIPLEVKPADDGPVGDLSASPSTVNGSRDVASTKDGNSRNSTGRPPTNPATYASPIVIVAAIIFFVVFQIPCLCKNS